MARRSPRAAGAPPQLAACLDDLGLGVPAGEGTAPAGRNHCWAGSTSSGRRVFVKRLRGNPEDARRRLRRTVEFAEAMYVSGLPTPHLLAACEIHLTLVSVLIEDARTGADLAEDDAFRPDLAAEAGTIVATLHSAPPEVAEDTSAPPMPDLDALPLATFLRLSGAEVTFWRLVQQDAAIAGCVTRLHEESRLAERVPVHGDLRLDQFLRYDDRLLLTDGEEFRRGDPARDVGGFAGEWLFRAVAGLPADLHGDLHGDTTEAEVVGVATRRLAERRPIVESFWNAYVKERAPDPGLAERATAFAGWHLIDRAAAGAARSSRLAAPLRAAMGVGRSALSNPGRFAATIGLA